MGSSDDGYPAAINGSRRGSTCGTSGECWSCGTGGDWWSTTTTTTTITTATT